MTMDLSNKRKLLMRSAEDLIYLIEKGAINVYYYLEFGIPKFDIIINNDGSITNDKGRPINKLVEKSEGLLLMIQSNIERVIAEESSQQTLF